MSSVEAVEPWEGAGDAGVIAVRRGPGANCSSIGSAVEMLFLSAAVGAAVLAAVVAALRPAAAEGEGAPAAEEKGAVEETREPKSTGKGEQE